MTNSSAGSAIQKNRLLWRCRRGTRELELLLYRYIDKRYDSLTAEEIQTLQEFVEQDHNSLNEWLLSGKEPHKNNKYSNIVKAIRNLD